MTILDQYTELLKVINSAELQIGRLRSICTHPAPFIQHAGGGWVDPHKIFTCTDCGKRWVEDFA